MSTIEPRPWFAVPPLSQAIGPDGTVVDVAYLGGGVARIGDGGAIVDPYDTVPLVLPELGDALREIFRAFPDTQVIEE
jgi:hypothetical protein